MKIQCDVCDKGEATIFCSADEAALCEACDHRVHHANKLASKHIRFSLLHPSLKDSPHCDICRERRALLFCQEDRALLCRECDIPIHKSNLHTQKHNRFLLTAIKLSPTSSTSVSSAFEMIKMSSRGGANEMLGRPNSTHHATSESTTTSHPCCVDSQLDASACTARSITQYLMETLPGWHVDDFLDPSDSPYAFCKGGRIS